MKSTRTYDNCFRSNDMHAKNGTLMQPCAVFGGGSKLHKERGAWTAPEGVN
jgi:hypothetical protein